MIRCSPSGKLHRESTYLLLALNLRSMDDTGQGLDDSVSSEDVGGEPGRARGY